MTTPHEHLQDLVRRAAELALEEQQHKTRKAKAEADLAEFCLEHVKKSEGILKLPDLRGGTS